SAWVTKSAALVPPDKYTYQPTKTVRTFGQLIAHVADAYDYYCGRAAGKDVQWSDATEKGKLDKVTLAAKLKQSTDACTAVFNGKGDPGQLLANIAHTSLHYGNVITYLRMLGLTPPSSS
ncbi:MAG TPA: DinB family protein, partial [Vicinamibacterales bacterium]